MNNSLAHFSLTKESEIGNLLEQTYDDIIQCLMVTINQHHQLVIYLVTVDC
jgi:hypothetical protein